MNHAVTARIVAPTAAAAPANDFVRRGTAVLGPPFLAPAFHAALVTEAKVQIANAGWNLTGQRAAGEIQQDSRRAYLGPLARTFLASAEVRSLLAATTGRNLQPSWSATCYTQYVGPGQHMGEHCDKHDACAIAMLTYLEASWIGPTPSPGLQLYVFGGDNAATGVVAVVTTHGNRAVILNGARQAHLRPPLAVGESLLMLAGCFRAA